MDRKTKWLNLSLIFTWKTNLLHVESRLVSSLASLRDRADEYCDIDDLMKFSDEVDAIYLKIKDYVEDIENGQRGL